VRYGDDIVVCCRSKEEAEAALKLIEKLLAKLELEVNPRRERLPIPRPAAVPEGDRAWGASTGRLAVKDGFTGGRRPSPALARRRRGI